MKNKTLPPKPISPPLRHKPEGGTSERWIIVLSFLLSLAITGIIIFSALITGMEKSKKIERCNKCNHIMEK